MKRVAKLSNSDVSRKSCGC